MPEPLQVWIGSATGARYRFDRNSDFTYRTGYPRYANTVRLQRFTSPVLAFEFSDENDQVTRFEKLNNRWKAVQIRERSGYIQNLAYDAAGHPASITDSFGQALTLTWTDSYAGYSGAVTQIDTPGGVRITYQYDLATSEGLTVPGTERLIGVTVSPSGGGASETTTYHYEDTNFRNLLTGITDARGVRYATFAYDVTGRVASTAHAGGADSTTIAYNDTTNERTVTNALGKSAIYKFQDNNGRLKLTRIDGQPSTNCPGSARTWTYDANSWVTQSADEEGRITKFVRNTKGQPTSITEGFGTPSARTVTKTWHATLNQPTQIVEPGLTTDLTYDTTGNLTQLKRTDTTTHTVPYSTGGQTRIWNYAYTAQGLLDTVDGPLPGVGDKVDYDYNASGYLTKVTNEVGHITTITALNGRGQPASVVDPNGVQSDLAYDFQGRLLTVKVNPGASQALTTLTYNAISQVASVTRPDGSSYSYSYDNARRLTTITRGDGEKIEYTRNAMGNITQRVIKAAGGSIVYTHTQAFDELGRLLRDIGAASQTFTYGYDKTDNLTSVTDPRSGVYAYAFDPLNRLIRETNEDSDAVTYTLNGIDALTTYSDRRGLMTSYVRNGFGDAIQESSPDTGITIFEFNGLGLVTKKTDARAIVADTTYDNAGRMLTRSFPAASAENVTFTYDSVAGGNKGKGRLTGMADGSGSTSFTYDVRGNTTAETRTIQGQAHTVAYAYTTADQVSQITYPSGRIVFYARDAQGRVTAVTTKKNAAATVATLASTIVWQPMAEMLQSLTYGNGLGLWKTFTPDYELDVLLVENLAAGTDVISRAHTRTDALNLTNIWDAVTPANNQAFWHTASNWLQNADGPWGELTYYYGPNGDRTYEIKTTGGVTTTDLLGYNGASNRVQDVTRGAATTRVFTYTPNGNIATDTRGATVYTYATNNANRLSSVTVGGQVKGTYLYNGQEQLAARTLANMTPAGPIHSLYDIGGRLIAETDGFGHTVREYVWLGDMPLAVVANVNTTPVTYYVHTDHLDRPIKMTNAAKASVWNATWLPFGTPHAITGTASLDARFSGQWFQLESGLAYNWHRHYDPTLGRYTQADPLGFVDGPSLYGYAGNSPQMWTDPEGLQTALPLPYPTMAAACVANPLVCAGAAAAAAGTAYICSVLMAQKGRQNEDNEWNDRARDPAWNPQSLSEAEWLDQQYKAARARRDTKAADKIKSAQKAAGARASRQSKDKPR